jgi:hypothetical protein
VTADSTLALLASSDCAYDESTNTIHLLSFSDDCLVPFEAHECTDCRDSLNVNGQSFKQIFAQMLDMAEAPSGAEQPGGFRREISMDFIPVCMSNPEGTQASTVAASFPIG